MSRLQKLQLERNAAWNLGGFPQTQKILKLRSTQRPATRRRRRRSRPWRSLEPSIAQPRHGFATQKSWKSRNPRYDERTLGRPPWDEAAIAEDDGIHNFGSFAYHIISYHIYIYVCVCKYASLFPRQSASTWNVCGH